VAWVTEELYVVCGTEQRVTVLSVNSTKPVTVFAGHENEVNQVRVNAARTLIASCSDDKTARLWSTSVIRPQPDGWPSLVHDNLVLRGHRASVNSIGWSGSADTKNEVLATASFDHESRIWDPYAGTCLCVFKDHTQPIFTLCFSRAGRLLATGAGDGHLHVYDVKTRTKVWSWRVDGRPIGIFDLAFQTTPEGERIAVALESGRVGVVHLKHIPALHARSL